MKFVLPNNFTKIKATRYNETQIEIGVNRKRDRQSLTKFFFIPLPPWNPLDVKEIIYGLPRTPTRLKISLSQPQYQAPDKSAGLLLVLNWSCQSTFIHFPWTEVSSAYQSLIFSTSRAGIAKPPTWKEETLIQLSRYCDPKPLWRSFWYRIRSGEPVLHLGSTIIPNWLEYKYMYTSLPILLPIQLSDIPTIKSGANQRNRRGYRKGVIISFIIYIAAVVGQK